MMKHYNCYACDGDYAEGYWLDVDGTDTFYCIECGDKQGLDESPYARKHEAE